MLKKPTKKAPAKRATGKVTSKGKKAKAEKKIPNKRSPWHLHPDYPIRAMRFSLTANGTEAKEEIAAEFRTKLFDAIESAFPQFSAYREKVERYVELLKDRYPLLWRNNQLQYEPLAIYTSEARKIFGDELCLPFPDCNAFLNRDTLTTAQEESRSLIKFTLINFELLNQVTANSIVIIPLDRNTSLSIYFGGTSGEGGWIFAARAMLSFQGKNPKLISKRVLKFLRPFEDDRHIVCRLHEQSWRSFGSSGDLLRHRVEFIRRAYGG